MSPERPKTVAIVQSNYIPWKGYFDLIASVDEFILLDDVQFTRRDWRNRNLIKTPQGTRWLTIPVLAKGQYQEKVCRIRVGDHEWPRRHWNSIRENYRAAPHFEAYSDLISGLYDAAKAETHLSSVNYLFLASIMEILGISTRLSWSMDYDVEGTKSRRLVALCEAAGASIYVSGPSARAYLDDRLFTERNIAVGYIDYTGYPEYPQLHDDFVHTVTALDLIFNVGPDARRYLARSAESRETGASDGGN